MAEPSYAMVRGRVFRVTRLDPCGALTPESEYVVSKGALSITATAKTYTHSGGAETNDLTDEVRFVHPEYDEVIGYDVDIEMLKVDPDVIEFVSGNPVIPDVDGVASGFGVDAGVKPQTFALEIWTKLMGARCSTGEWGYTLFPRLYGGVLSGLTIADSLATMKLVGATARRGSKWGDGLYKDAGFGLEPMGLGPFGSVDVRGGYGYGPFGLTPFDTTDVPGVDLTPYNRFWTNCLVNGHPAPNRRIIAATNA